MDWGAYECQREREQYLNTTAAAFLESFIWKTLKICQNINKNRMNDEYLLNLVQNNTSVVDGIINIIKRSEKSTSSRLTEMRATINRVMDLVDNNPVLLRKSQQFTVMALQLFVLATHLQHAQAETINIQTHSSHEKISPQILTPKQLSIEIALIKEHITSNLELPISNTCTRF